MLKNEIIMTLILATLWILTLAIMVILKTLSKTIQDTEIQHNSMIKLKSEKMAQHNNTQQNDYTLRRQQNLLM